MAYNNDDKFNNTRRKKRYTGKLKWLDPQGFGYIICVDVEVLVTPSSLTSETIQEGDQVKFSVKSHNSIHKFEAIEVEQFGVKCFRCERTGHKHWECPENMKYFWINCYKCGLIGHYADNCDQELYGWFPNKTYYHSRIRGPYNGWLSLFGEKPRNSGGQGVVGLGSTSTSIVCVKEEGDVRKVEEVEDCFILEFDPTRGGGGSDDDDCEGTSSTVCVKKGEDVKKVEEIEDCLILEFDPTELDNFSNLSLCVNSEVVNDEDDLSILAEKGQVACRDYPHPRHLCATYPFKKTLHGIHCKMCYCYICDKPAPCENWTNGYKGQDLGFNHCDATDDNPIWMAHRILEKMRAGV